MRRAFSHDQQVPRVVVQPNIWQVVAQRGLVTKMCGDGLGHTGHAPINVETFVRGSARKETITVREGRRWKCLPRNRGCRRTGRLCARSCIALRRPGRSPRASRSPASCRTPKSTCSGGCSTADKIAAAAAADPWRRLGISVVSSTRVPPKFLKCSSLQGGERYYYWSVATSHAAAAALAFPLEDKSLPWATEATTEATVEAKTTCCACARSRVHTINTL